MPKEATNYWKKYALRCAENGWPLVLLGNRSKRPIQAGWQEKKMSIEQVKKLAASTTSHGIGIQCGNIIGLDDDHELGGIVTEEFLEALEELKDKYFPKAPKRKGRASRAPLRVIRLADGASYKSFDLGKFQILGRGKQFVAYNIHPDTGKPYSWIDGKGPAAIRLKDIPVVSEEKLRAFTNSLYALEEAFGLASDKETRNAVRIKIRRGETLDKPELAAPTERALIAACKYLVNEEHWGWDEWSNNIMLPLYMASNGSDLGLELAHKVSAQREDIYDYDETENRWKEISKSKPAWLGWPRIYWQARQNGMPTIGATSWDNLIFVKANNGFYDTTTNFPLDKSVFNMEYIHFGQTKPTMNPDEVFYDTRKETQVVDQLGWDPEKPHGLVERKINGHGGALKIWNTWYMPDWFGEEGNIDSWLWYMRNVYGDEIEVATKRMAFDVQYPHLRAQWHIAATGLHGIGKSACLLPLELWGEKYDMVVCIENATLKSEFNDYISRKKLVMMHEPEKVNKAVLNDVKNLLASTRDVVRINQKFMSGREESLKASFWFGGNAEDALALDPTERRIHPVHSDAPSPTNMSLKDKRPYVERFNDIKNKSWKHVIWYLKHKVKVDKDYGASRPGNGPSKQQLKIAEMVQSPQELLGSYIKELVEDMPIFTVGHIMSQLGRMDDLDKKFVEPYHITNALRRLGGLKCLGGRSVRVGGRHTMPVRFWTLAKELENVQPKRLREIWTFLEENFDM